jgi:hypothetical protein
MVLAVLNGDEAALSEVAGRDSRRQRSFWVRRVTQQVTSLEDSASSEVASFRAAIRHRCSRLTHSRPAGG